MIPFARRVHAATHRRVVAVTAAQSGKTDNILDIIGARLDQRPAPILYVGPSDEFVETQFEPRLMGLLDEAENLSGKVARGKRMRKKLKQVAGVRVRLASGRSSTALKSDPFALGIVDEIDEMVANIQGQGDPLGLVEARGETYADFVTAIVSTPSQGIVETEVDPINGLTFWRIGDAAQVTSPVWRLFQQGTRHHFAWACPHCGEYFIPMRQHLMWPKGATPAQARREAYLQCPQGCADPIENHHKAEMIAAGVMIAPGQTIEEAFAEENEPDNSTWSSWTSGLCSPFVTWGERAEKLLTAQLSGEEDKVQTVVNANFGECYTPGAHGDLPEWKAIVDHRAKPSYLRGQAPLGVLRVVAGVDVQKRSLVYVIRGYGSRGTSWLLDYGYLLGPTNEPEVWNDLTLKMTAPIGGLMIEKVFIDSGFRPDKPDLGDEHKVYEWAHRNSFIAMPTKGRQTLGGTPFIVSKIEVKPDGKRAPYSIDLVHINTDFFKGLVHSRIKTPLDEPGAFFLFSEPDDEKGDAYEDYARQLLSEARVLGPKHKPEWVKRQRANHFLDCEALAAAAAYMLNVQSIPEGIERRGEPDPASAGTPGSEVEKAAAFNAGSIRDRFRNMGASRTTRLR